ncbi:hypothetical protein QMK33_06470 [Hymenobacter sp. H14-R3]|uniref:hypothetical protein n=1 Tax=Hymenobacter sp. H14-R3 TaxID=3046308 RepID=UPI0024BB4A40|nr:hypothetical protein [Hymenobacter sp. H14-R3]MDJ0364790.1 hypothetical protein [Hymenobacter sp. H14-R3]
MRSILPWRGWLAGLLGLAGCSTPSPDHPAQLPLGTLAALRGTWLLVPEASHADTLTYRPNTYRFRYRPAGRPGFQLGLAGRFTRYDTVAGGGLVAQEGTWVETSTGRLLIHLPELEPTAPDYELELLTYDKQVLQLRRLTKRPAVEIIRNQGATN